MKPKFMSSDPVVSSISRFRAANCKVKLSLTLGKSPVRGSITVFSSLPLKLQSKISTLAIRAVRTDPFVERKRSHSLVLQRPVIEAGAHPERYNCVPTFADEISSDPSCTVHWPTKLPLTADQVEIGR